jgi:queuosine precursor transporter
MGVKIRWTALLFLLYVVAIAGSNWLITHMGIPAGPGTHLTEVGFGLLAPSGVWAAAVSFPARDYVQRAGGRWLGILAILVGAGLSFFISSPVIALASGGTYLLSETADMLVYTPLQKRWFVPAVIASGVVAIVVDSVVFLHWAGLYSTSALEGLILGKAWIILLAVPVTYLLRRRGPLAVAA